jgi:hypothetical protein
MRRRCYKKTDDKYDSYGGRGITICDEWRKDFMSFYNWSMANGYEDDLEIDRINSDGNYCPENCRWVTHLVNTQNVRKKKQNTSGYKGASLNGRRWRANIKSSGKQYSIGYFDTPKEAAIAYNNWVIEHKTAHKLNDIT